MARLFGAVGEAHAQAAVPPAAGDARPALAMWIVPLITFAGVMAGGYLARALLISALGRWAARSRNRLDDLVVAAVRWPSHLWVVTLALLVAANGVDLPGTLEGTVRKILTALLILSFTFVASRLVVGMVQQYSARLAPEMAVATAGVTQTIVQWLVVIVGLLVLLSTIGVNVAPLLGALGVGGLAVGLALQPTLSNVFAGFQIAVARQIRPGQRVRLSSGEEGYVTDIQWRTTTLRTPSNHLIIIPNSKLAESIVTNFDMPDPPANIVIQVGVAYDSDTRHVEKVLLDEAHRIVQSRPEFVRDFEPIVRFQAYRDSSLEFLVILRVGTFDEQFGVWSEIHHRIFERLRREGIEIPFPVRTVYLRGETVPEAGPR